MAGSAEGATAVSAALFALALLVGRIGMRLILAGEKELGPAPYTGVRKVPARFWSW